MRLLTGSTRIWTTCALSLPLLACAAKPPVSPQKAEAPSQLMQAPLALSKECLLNLLSGMKSSDPKSTCLNRLTGTASNAPDRQ